LAAIVQRYAERYPNRRFPFRQTFINLAHRLRETGSVLPKNQLVGRGGAEGLAAVEEEILERAEEDPGNLPEKWVLVTGLYGELYKKIYYTHITFSECKVCPPNNFPPRRRCCRWFQRKITENPLFHATILMSHD
jgi:hypothetical protein